MSNFDSTRSNAVPKRKHDEKEDDWTKNIRLTEVVFIRHAESSNNVLYDFIRETYGEVSEEFLEAEETRLRQPDCSLSEKGVKQVLELQNFIASGKFGQSINIDLTSTGNWVILSSPMRRCLLTSQALYRGLNEQCTIYVRPDLYESGGCYDSSKVGLSGSTKAEVEGEFPEYKCLPGMEEGWYAGRTKCETSKEFQVRAKGIIDWLWMLHDTSEQSRQLISGVPLKNLVLVIHGNLLNAVITGLMGQAGHSFITHYNTGVTKVQLVTGKNGRKAAALKCVNMIEHLPLPATSTEGSSLSLRTGNDTLSDHWVQEFEDLFPN